MALAAKQKKDIESCDDEDKDKNFSSLVNENEAIKVDSANLRNTIDSPKKID